MRDGLLRSRQQHHVVHIDDHGSSGLLVRVGAADSIDGGPAEVLHDVVQASLPKGSSLGVPIKGFYQTAD